MNRLEARTPSYFSKGVYGGVFAASTSGVNATAIVDSGVAINQLENSSFAAGAQSVGVETGKKFEGIRVDIPVSFVGDSGASMTYSLSLRSSSASGGTYANFATGDTVIANSGTATGQTVGGVASLSASIVGVKKFIKYRCSRVGNAHDTGGAQLASNALVTFFGPNYSPATA